MTPPQKDKSRVSHHHAVGNLYHATSIALNKRPEGAVGGSFPDMSMMVVNQPDGKGNIIHRLWLVDPSEGFLAASSLGMFKDPQTGELLNGAIIRPQLTGAGELEFAYQLSPAKA